ncbi:hypothetical protein NDU88_010677 [Pleurodeles waltl]|uniref:Uncharacterized protein n=1 Tax=Pleurodeles waltl TaxID=8319 RepID=A0AAV7R0X2_PLEWA|nr:hypothetical protein NDU88_010677 [Pleurodeles waltl]
MGSLRGSAGTQQKVGPSLGPAAAPLAHQVSLLEARSLLRCASQDRHPSAGPQPCSDPPSAPSSQDSPEAPDPGRRGSTPIIKCQGEHPSQPGRSGHARSPPGARAAPHSNVPPPWPSKVPPNTAGPSGPGLQPRPGPLPKPSAGAFEFPSASWPLHTGASISLYMARFTGSQGE